MPSVRVSPDVSRASSGGGQPTDLHLALKAQGKKGVPDFEELLAELNAAGAEYLIGGAHAVHPPRFPLRGLGKAGLTNRDWEDIFVQPEMLATGLALHARAWRRTGDDDYRFMSHRAEISTTCPTAGNPRGTAGSVYAMGRRISGRHRYGAGVYRDRVNALLRRALLLL